jgi:predicted double-glycine peptidase
MIPAKRHHEAVNRTNAVHGLFLLLTLAVSAILLGGCSERSFSAIKPGIETRGHYIEGVPFFRQTEYDCGPAALAAVLAFGGRPVPLETITASVYLPKLHGTLPMDMERYAKDAGFTVRSSSGTAASLKEAVRSNDPVICLLDLGFGIYKQPHYVTVIGFDDGNGLYIMHDGETPDRTMPYDRFEKAWARAGRWMIVVTSQ